MKKSLTLVVCASLLTSGGCASGAGPFGLGALVGDRTLAAAEPLFGPDEDKCFDSPGFLLRIFHRTHAAHDANVADHSADRRGKQKLDCNGVIDDFYEGITRRAYDAETTPDKPEKGARPALTEYNRIERNEIVDALMAASNRKCSRYTEFLKSYDGSMNSSLSVASIVAGGLGGVVSGEATAKALSTASSIISGSRSALNEVHFTNQTIQVLSAAYEKARRDQRRDISHRQACPVDYYTLMHGIADAFDYHNSCSITTGLQEAAKAVGRAENPGIDTMKRTLAELTAFRRQATAFLSDDPTSGKLDVEIGKIRMTLAQKAQGAIAKEVSASKDAEMKEKLAKDAETAGDADAVAKRSAADAANIVYENARTERDKAITDLAQLQVTVRNINEAEGTRSLDEVANCPYTAQPVKVEVPATPPAAPAPVPVVVPAAVE